MFERPLAGLFLHPTSLPGPHGWGDIGAAARAWVDLLADSGLGLWQMLPIHPPDGFGSPYQPRSAFAGSPGLVGLEDLVEDGWLEPADLGSLPSRAHTDRERGGRLRERLLRRAWERFRERPDPDFDRFRQREAHWLDDWALWAALAGERDGRWWRWEPELRRREPDALETERARLDNAIGYRAFEQWLFDRQWRRLRAHAHARGVQLLGDLPMFIGRASADAWARPGLLGLEDGHPRRTAGVPPAEGDSHGQRWGLPLWDWEACAADDWAYPIARLRRTLELFDLVRLDHFEGYARTWSLAGDETADAAGGRHEPGPGAELFTAVEAALGPLPFVLEDFGHGGDDVRALREAIGLPGMRLLQHAFEGGDGEGAELPHDWPASAVGYTSTHDTDTWRGWLRRPGGSDPGARRRSALDYLGTDVRGAAWAALEAVWRSPVALAVAPVQDLLGLGARARLNRPGTAHGNWTWRLRSGRPDRARLERLAELTRASGRATDAP